MLYLCATLCLMLITTTYSADKKNGISLDEILQQVSILACQVEASNLKIDKLETQIQELYSYNKKLRKRIKKANRLLLNSEKSLKRSSSCPELIAIDQRLSNQEKDLQALHKRIQMSETDQRLIREEIQRITIKGRRSEERDELTRREIEQLKRSLAKNQYH